MGKFLLTIFVGIPLAIVVGWKVLLAFEDAGAERAKEWDKKIDALCSERFQKDKAYQVFERVDAPAGYFNESGKFKAVPVFSEGEGFKPLPGESILSRFVEREVLREARPRVSIYAEEIVRYSDGKILGERYLIIRAGSGGRWDLGYLNRHRCPQDNSDLHLIVDVFLNVTNEHVSFGEYK